MNNVKIVMKTTKKRLKIVTITLSINLTLLFSVLLPYMVARSTKNRTVLCSVDTIGNENDYLQELFVLSFPQDIDVQNCLLSSYLQISISGVSYLIPLDIDAKAYWLNEQNRKYVVEKTDTDERIYQATLMVTNMDINDIRVVHILSVFSSDGQEYQYFIKPGKMLPMEDDFYADKHVSPLHVSISSQSLDDLEESIGKTLDSCF